MLSYDEKWKINIKIISIFMGYIIVKWFAYSVSHDKPGRPPQSFDAWLSRHSIVCILYAPSTGAGLLEPEQKLASNILLLKKNTQWYMWLIPEGPG